jgi:hypothetical protein
MQDIIPSYFCLLIWYFKYLDIVICNNLRGAASLRKDLIVLISRSVLCAKSGVIPGHYERYKMSI